MKNSYVWAVLGVIVFFTPFFLFDSVYNVYNQWNTVNPISLAFLKFAILATFGEVLGCIKTGKYIVDLVCCRVLLFGDFMECDSSSYDFEAVFRLLWINLRFSWNGRSIGGGFSAMK